MSTVTVPTPASVAEVRVTLTEAGVPAWLRDEAMRVVLGADRCHTDTLILRGEMRRILRLIDTLKGH